MQYKIATFNFGTREGYRYAEWEMDSINRILQDNPDIIFCQELIGMNRVKIEAYDIFSSEELSVVFKSDRFQKVEKFYTTFGDGTRILGINLYEQGKKLICIDVHAHRKLKTAFDTLDYCAKMIIENENIIIAGDCNHAIYTRDRGRNIDNPLFAVRKYIVSDTKNPTTEGNQKVDFIFYKPFDGFVVKEFSWENIDTGEKYDHHLIISDFKTEKGYFLYGSILQDEIYYPIHEENNKYYIYKGLSKIQNIKRGTQIYCISLDLVKDKFVYDPTDVLKTIVKEHPKNNTVLEGDFISQVMSEETKEYFLIFPEKEGREYIIDHEEYGKKKVYFNEKNRRPYILIFTDKVKKKEIPVTHYKYIKPIDK